VKKEYITRILKTPNGRYWKITLPKRFLEEVGWIEKNYKFVKFEGDERQIIIKGIEVKE